MPRCDVVICAHNEEKTIANVLQAVKGSSFTNRINVVADRCIDKTPDIARFYKANVWNVDAGDKGTAMAVGLHGVVTDNVLFLDADLRGIHAGHIDRLCAPDLYGQVLGIRDGSSNLEKWLRFPSVTGDRRVPITIALEADLEGAGWEAETRINYTVMKHGLPTVYIKMEGVQNRSKIIRDPVGWGVEAGQVGYKIGRMNRRIWPMRKGNQ